MIRLTPPRPFRSPRDWQNGMPKKYFGPWVERIPLMGVGEAEKRASMAVTNPNDPHLVGYLMFQLMVQWGTDPDRLVMQAVSHANDPNGLLGVVEVPRDVALESTTSRLFPESRTAYLLPEVTFEIDGLAPLIKERRVIPPASAAP